MLKNSSSPQSAAAQQESTTTPSAMKTVAQSLILSQLTPLHLLQEHKKNYNNLVVCSPQDSLQLCLAKMAKHNILSLAISSLSAVRLVALVNIADILNFLLTHLNTTTGSFDSASASKLLSNTPIEQVLTLDADSESYLLRQVDFRDSLLDVMKQFVSQKLHRLLVTDHLNQLPPAIISQFDILRYLDTHYKELGWSSSELASSPILSDEDDDYYNEQAAENQQRRPHVVFTMSSDEAAIQGFLIMKEANVLGLPILNESLQIVGSLSASNLRGLSSENLTDLQLPVLDYISKQHQQKNDHHRESSSSASETSSDQITTTTTTTTTLPASSTSISFLPSSNSTTLTCTPDTPFMEVISLLVKNHVHRVWIVETDTRKVVGVVSMSDVIRRILK